MNTTHTLTECRDELASIKRDLERQQRELDELSELLPAGVCAMQAFAARKRLAALAGRVALLERLAESARPDLHPVDVEEPMETGPWPPHP